MCISLFDHFTAHRFSAFCVHLQRNKQSSRFRVYELKQSISNSRAMSSGFVTESEIAEARQKRQAEWEKVRQPDQPMELPEEPYDSRSLYERLKEQKDKKDLDFEESHKLKNLIRGLDDDEVDFLDIVDKAKMDAEKKQQIEEDNELMEFRQRVATLQEKSMDQKISAETAKPKSVKIVSSRPSQKSILAGIVRKRKPSPSSDEPNEQPKKRTPNELTNANDSNEKKPVAVVNKEDKPVAVVNKEEKISPIAQQNVEEKINPSKSSPPESPIVVSDLSKYDEGALKCIGILPGIGKYTESSDSEKSTDTDDEYDFGEFDWMGRKTKQDGEGSGCH